MFKQNRRGFLKTIGLGAAYTAVGSPLLLLEGCPSVDVIMDGLKVASDVVKVAKVTEGLNPEVAEYLGKIAVDLDIVIKTYADYEAALPADKVTKADLIKATISGINSNLGSILTAIGVKNPAIRIAVAVVNTALLAVMSKIFTAKTTQGKLLHNAATPELPVIGGAKTGKDLKNAWNKAVVDNNLGNAALLK